MRANHLCPRGSGVHVWDCGADAPTIAPPPQAWQLMAKGFRKVEKRFREYTAGQCLALRTLLKPRDHRLGPRERDAKRRRCDACGSGAGAGLCAGGLAVCRSVRYGVVVTLARSESLE